MEIAFETYLRVIIQQLLLLARLVLSICTKNISVPVPDDERSSRGHRDGGCSDLRRPLPGLSQVG